jgi:proteasome lid subunit RPN8/RPN11
MLKIGRRHVEAIEHHAAREYPRECCGLLIGRITVGGSVREVVELFPVANSFEEEGERHHRMRISPLDYARAERAYAARNLGVVGNYHSHPDHDAIPSRFDLEHLAPWPTMSYVVVSVRGGEPAESRSWQLEPDRSCFTEEKIVTVAVDD